MMLAAQSTSDPRLECIPPPAPTSTDPNPRPVFRPPYPIDEESFVDACDRLVSVEDAASQLGESNRENRSRDRDRPKGESGGGGVDGDGKAVLTDLLLRSLACFASFR